MIRRQVPTKASNAFRVPTRPGIPGKMSVHFENLYTLIRLKGTQNLEKFGQATKNLPPKSDFENPVYNLRLLKNKFLHLLVVKLT